MKNILIPALLLVSVNCFAQQTDEKTDDDPKGTVSGRIKNAQENAVEGAKVFVYNGTDIVGSGTTDATGWFLTDRFLIGTYQVRVLYKGYKKAIATDVPVKLNQNTEIALKIFPMSDEEDTTSVYSSYNIVAVKKAMPKPEVKATQKKSLKKK